MATKIQVIYNDETPVEGATVLAGGIGESALTTNERGNVTLPTLDDGWEGFVDIRVEAGGDLATATLHIIEGEVNIMNLGKPPE